MKSHRDHPANLISDRRCAPRRTAAAFTMVEIALCLAIIGFALVAIIGILPSGMNVQKDNREETIIKEDATYLINALQGGARGMYDLDAYVESITVSNNVAGAVTYTQSQLLQEQLLLLNSNLTNRISVIIGLLSTPKYLPFANVTNRVTASMYAISGSAIEKPPSTARDVAFKYQLTSEVVPIQTINPNLHNFAAPNLTPEERTVRSNLWAQARQQTMNLYELRLTFRWPLLASGRTGGNKQVYRTTVSGRLAYRDAQGNSVAFDGKYNAQRRYYLFEPNGPYLAAP